MHSTWESNNNDLFIMLLFYILLPEHPHTTMSTEYVDIDVFVAIRTPRTANDPGATIANAVINVLTDENQQTKQLDDWGKNYIARGFQKITVRVPLYQAKIVTQKTSNLDEYLKNLSNN